MEIPRRDVEGGGEREKAVVAFVKNLTKDVERALEEGRSLKPEGYNRQHEERVMANAEYDFQKIGEAIREGKPLVFILEEEWRNNAGENSIHLFYIYATLKSVNGSIRVEKIHNVLDQAAWPNDGTSLVHRIEEGERERVLTLAKIHEGIVLGGTDFFGVYAASPEKEDEDGTVTLSRAIYAAREEKFNDKNGTMVDEEGNLIDEERFLLMEEERLSKSLPPVADMS